jgi:hypothetical protein
MAFTGDLEHLPIIDIIQLVHTTRKSGIFSIKGSTGESKIVFRNGSIVSANHIDNSVRIGSVLLKTGAITMDDLKQAMDVMKQEDKDRLPLLATLVKMGRLKREDALRGLKKLVVLTIVELMSWTKGTFTFDTDAIVIASDGGQDLGVDAQMVLMDALRVFDERERDRAEGKEVLSLKALYSDALPEEGVLEAELESELESELKAKGEGPTVTADDLGLGDLDHLEKKIPRPVSEMEIFDPIEIQRRKIKELLPGFSSEEQEAFVAFLSKSGDRMAAADAAAKQSGKAVVICSGDALISHSVMSLCNDEGVVVFATGDDKELDRMVSQCLLSDKIPMVVFDAPAGPEGGFSRATIEGLRKKLHAKYAVVPMLQFAFPQETDFILRSYHEGVTAVLPRPSKEDRKKTYIQDTIQFLDAFKSYVRGFQYGSDDAGSDMKMLKESGAALRGATNPSESVLVVLTAVAGMFERAVTLVARGTELIGERSLGIGAEKSAGPAPADQLKVQLSQPSVFRDAVEKGRVYYGESGDETLRAFFSIIGRPMSPAVILLPLICDGKVVALIYGDFGQKEASPVRLDMLEVLAQQAGIALEYAIYRRQSAKAAQK